MTEAAHKSSSAPQAAKRASRAPGREHPDVASDGSPMAVMQGLAGNRALSSALGTGQPLPPALREEMESRFGTAFDDVRIHDDTPAHARAADLHAKAYTHGHDIVFSAHRFAPQSFAGKRLLAHELAHVVQQRRGGAAPVMDPQASHEQSADAAADAVAAGQSPVSVAGATGAGIARDEEEGWTAKLRRKMREAKDKIPAEYREKIQKAADYAADKVVDAAALPFGPVASYGTHGLGSAMLHGAQKAVAGEEGAADEVKVFAADKAKQGLGAAKGVATQVTEVVDTAMWVGNEYKVLRDKTAEKLGGPEGSVGNKLVKQAFNATARVVPGMTALPELGDASDAAKKHGLVDEQTGQASITAPMSAKANALAKAAEKKLGGTPDDESAMFTQMEKAEIAASLGTQVALSAVGVEEVKVAMNAIGAIGGLRTAVETIRTDPGWKTSPRFWGHIFGIGLSLVGLRHAMAASKFTTLALRYGSVVTAVPVLGQLAVDYYKLETSPQMPQDERQKLEASIKQGWIAVIHIVKDAILHIAQSQGAKPKGAGGGPEEGAPAAAAKAAPAEEGSGPKPAPNAVTADEAASPAPVAAKPTADVPAGPVVAAPLVKPAAVDTPPVPATPQPDAPTPIAAGKGKPTSAASKTLDANLAKQAPGKAGSVTRLPTRKAGATPPSEPVAQAKPAVVEMPEKIAVGQTHGPGAATAGKPALSVLPGGKQPTMASLKQPGSKPSVVAGAPGPTTSAKGTSTPGGTTSGPAKTSAKPKPAKASSGKAATAGEQDPVGAGGGAARKGGGKSPKARTTSPSAKDIDARLQALDVPPDQRAAFKMAADAVRKTAGKNPAAAERLLQGLEERFGGGSIQSQVKQDFESAQKKLYPEKGPDNKYRQSTAADERAQLEQARPAGKAVLKAKVRESERLGATGGQAQAAKEGIEVKDWNTPQQWKGDFGKGPDGLGARGNKRQFLEFKGGSSPLGKSNGVTEMSNEWAGRKIAELEVVGDRATAADLLKAAREGNLQGVVYRTRQLKAGETTSRLKGHQLRDHLRNEKISDSGLIEYSKTKVERAYQKRKQELEQALKEGNLRGLKNL